MTISFKSCLFSVFVSFFVITEEGFSYFDPGTGSILIQMLIALIGGVILFYHRVVFEIKRLTTKFIKIPAVSKMRYVSHYHHRHYLLATQISIFVVIFYSSHNISELTAVDFIFNIFLFVSFGVLFTLVCSLVLRKNKNRDQILYGMLFLLFIFYMRSPIIESSQLFYTFIHGESPTLLYKLIFAPILGIIFFCAGWKLHNNTIKIMALIAIMSLLPTYKLVEGVYLRVSEKEVDEATTQQLLLSDRSAVFQSKPNLYFLIFDSYTNLEGMELLGLSSKGELEKLQKRGFRLYPHFFTNFQSTLYALASYFNMAAHINGKSIYHAYDHNIREIIAGNSKVHHAFAANNYDMYVFSDDRYLTGNNCFVSSCIYANQKPLFLYFNLFDNLILGNLLKSSIVVRKYEDMFTTLTNEQSGEISGKFSGNMLLSLRTLPYFVHYLDYFRQSQNNYFAFVNLYAPGHTKTYSLIKGLCNQKKELEEYRSRVSYTNKSIINLINKIDNTDPNSLVILASDHGPYIFNGCSNNAPLLTREEVVERQGVLLAIRWGKDYDGRYDKDIKSSANLFRYIFSYLAGNEKLLENKPDDDAFYKYKGEIIKSIDDGVILPLPAADLRKDN